jgi:hypothetical protein
VFNVEYQQAKLRQDELIRDARKQRLAASLKQPAPRRRSNAPAFSLRIVDLRPAI